MTEKQEKNKSGAGKFFLGAAIGAAVGAIASKFIQFGGAEDEEEELEIKEHEAKPKAQKTEPKAKKAESKTKS